MTTAKKILWSNVITLVGSITVWIAALIFGWLNSVVFVAHVSMAALVFTAWSGIAASDAAVEAEKE